MTDLPAPSRFFSHFAVTLRLADATSDLLVRRIPVLRDCVALARLRRGLEIDTATVLPAEMHLLCRMMPGDEPGSALRLIRDGFARHAADGRPIWDVELPITRIHGPAIEARRRFILAAPVRAGLVRDAADWPYSSLHHHGAPRRDLAVA
ncbi:MAG: hypothetical protein GVY31_01190 [Alphaproteobacteria bacterium]|jgi:putative transposase|nr:hypothetical protein [Alphaproteobacteria bacterium]